MVENEKFPKWMLWIGIGYFAMLMLGFTSLPNISFDPEIYALLSLLLVPIILITLYYFEIPFRSDLSLRILKILFIVFSIVAMILSGLIAYIFTG